MKTPTGRKQSPIVIAVPKRKWRIPRLDEMSRRREVEREEFRLKQLGEGTTPQGRELLRKLKFLCEQRLQSGRSVAATAAEAEFDVREFAMLRKEWSLLLSRAYRVELPILLEARPYFFAWLLVAIVAAEMSLSPSKRWSLDSAGSQQSSASTA